MLKLLNIQNTLLLKILIIIICVFPYLQTLYFDFYNGDEANYSAHAMLILKGSIPYKDFIEKKPPLIYYTYYIIYNIFGNNIHFIHLLSILVVLVSAYFCFQIGKIIKNYNLAYTLSILYALFNSAFLEMDALASNCENFMNMHVIISVYFFLLSLIKKKYFYDFFSGIFIILAIGYKHQAAILLLAYALTFIFIVIQNRSISNIKNVIKQSLLIILGVTLVLVFTILYFYLNNALDDFIYCNVNANFEYINSGIAVSEYIFKGISRITLFILSSILLWFFGLIIFRKKFFNNVFDKLNGNKILGIFILIWLLLTFIPVSIGGHFYGHYFLQFYPPLCILAAIGLNFFLEDKYYFNKIKQSKILHNLIIIFAVLPVISFQIASIIRIQYEDFEPAKEYIKALCNSIKNGERKANSIFVWGNFAYPYYFLNAFPSTPFVVCEYIVPYWYNRYNEVKKFDFNDLTDNNLKNYNKLIISLEKNKPDYIIDTSNSKEFEYWNLYKLHLFKELNNIIKKNYKLYTTANGIDVYVYCGS